MRERWCYGLKSGKFIVFEGIDGAGKSTQIAFLRDTLAKMGYTVHLTAEPTDLDTGRMLRAALSGDPARSACEMAALFTLDRIAHNKEIEKALCAGEMVICDRYYYSSLAYQGSLCDYDWVKNMNIGCPDIRRPDLCVFLDLMPKDAIARITARGEAAEIYEKEETLSLFRDTFHRVFASLEDKVAIVNAAPAPEVIATEVLAAVKEIL